MEILKLLSSYFAGKREIDAEGYDRVLILDSDAAMVALLMEDAALRIAPFFPAGRLLRWRYYRSAIEFTIAGGAGTATAELDTEGLHTMLAKSVGQEVLRRWLRLTGSDYADALSAPGDELADALAIYFPGKQAVRASSRRVPPM